MTEPRKNPFVGPRPLERKEAFFGRTTELRELYDRLSARRIVLLHSPSGAGKSSLIAAGLVPRLERDGFVVLPTIRVHHDYRARDGVSANANRYLLSMLVSLEEASLEVRRTPAQLAALPGLGAWLEDQAAGLSDGRTPVLIFDQFEEILSTDPHAIEEKHAFFRDLGAALDKRDLSALFVLREDYLGALAPYRDHLPTRLANTFRLDLLTREAAKDAAERIAKVGGRSFPAVDQLITDLAKVVVQQPDGTEVEAPGPYVEPVHLQVVCKRLWDRMRPDDDSIDPEDLRDYADVSSALGDYYADAVHEAAGKSEVIEREIRDWVGERLISGNARTPVRREAGGGAGPGPQHIRALVDRYLVRTEQRAGAFWYELSHDRMVEPIQKDNQRWFREHLQPFQDRAKHWVEGRRAPELLLSAEALDEAEIWDRANPGLVKEVEKEFLEASRTLRTREAEDRAWEQQQQAEERRRLRRLRTTAAISVVVAAIVAVLGLLVWQKMREAEKLQKLVQAKDENIANLLAEQNSLVDKLKQARNPMEVRALARQLQENGEKIQEERVTIKEIIQDTTPKTAEAPRDQDRDGVRDKIDHCLDKKEDVDQFEDDDGCPDPDNDQDKVSDITDKCPMESEDVDFFEDEDGCPDPDNDKDGILDGEDACPTDVGTAPTQGCPDSDGDLVPDLRDTCPDRPIDRRVDPKRSDGCPAKVIVKSETVVILRKISFDFGTETPTEESYALLAEIAAVINGNSQLKLIEVASHTDSKGSADYNLDLSQARAESVVRYLVEVGKVDASRLVPVGYGETNPIDTNNTAEGRERNRRVEFNILATSDSERTTTADGSRDSQDDSDKDGVLDREDGCPSIAGPREALGCPVRVTVTASQIKILEKISFDDDKATIKAGSSALLAEIARTINAKPQITRIEVAGHTDNVGNDAYNLALSQARAEAVVQHLVDVGKVDPSRLVPVGYGETKPIDTNDTEEGRANNRRMEFTILPSGGN